MDFLDLFHVCLFDLHVLTELHGVWVIRISHTSASLQMSVAASTNYPHLVYHKFVVLVLVSVFYMFFFLPNLGSMFVFEF